MDLGNVLKKNRFKGIRDLYQYTPSLTTVRRPLKYNQGFKAFASTVVKLHQPNPHSCSWPPQAIQQRQCSVAVPTLKSTANGVDMTLIYLTLDTSLLVAKFQMSWVTLGGVS